MGSIFNDDFIEFIEILNKHNVKYILVGGYSVIIHGHSRTTGDLDIWAIPSKENYIKLKRVFSEFGLPSEDFTEYNFLENSSIDVFTFGRPPISIDIMKEVKGLNFEKVFEKSFIHDVSTNCKVRVIHKNHLIDAKKASARPKDFDDIQNLE